MSMIFDKFPSQEAAEAFLTATKQGGRVFLTDAAAFEDDPRPFECVPPIVHIDRSDDADTDSREAGIQELVTKYGGEFAGT